MKNRIFEAIQNWVDDENLGMSILKIYVVAGAFAGPICVLTYYLFGVL